MSPKEKIVYSAVIVLLAILIVLVYERDAEPEQVIVQIVQDESHPHPHPLRFRSPDELRAWRLYATTALRKGWYHPKNAIVAADSLIRAERERKP